ncbi:VPLPA-CTERM sorting domain-containing protein [Epibacterium sp. SM1969]|uniref:VPLPA-CTERM sorting domain-containing protein n=1 Tax=Tritonibacter aquimaris TaxID=2663379 RepID=A0A844AVS1_9RHOB|nr:VPLPA-CTERM sorting domain-containing protein [Tritonibacter aquimaris]MQY42494.1 VPLPA-CTERM sorting domain-containing protein [Tritonibacter aquimaris]
MIRKLLLSGVSAAAIICANTAGAATFTFGFTGQVESGAIETSGTYELRLRGADGGVAGASFLEEDVRGGFGALLLGEIDLLAGDLFRVLVGGDGVSGYVGSGGGGLSYFSSGAHLAIAGGGGGTSGSGYFYTSAPGYDAYGAEGGRLGSGGASSTGRSVYIGEDGPEYFDYTFGGGGAGWLGDGNGAYGGYSGPDWRGGSFSGGFGGGGGFSYSGADEVGGGGAGSSGGNSGEAGSYIVTRSNGYSYAQQGYYGPYGGQGGSSYFSSAFLNTSSVVGQARVGGAYLTLDLLSQPAPVPLPASAALLGSTIAGMGFVARRRKKKS